MFVFKSEMETDFKHVILTARIQHLQIKPAFRLGWLLLIIYLISENKRKKNILKDDTSEKKSDDYFLETSCTEWMRSHRTNKGNVVYV